MPAREVLDVWNLYVLKFQNGNTIFVEFGLIFTFGFKILHTVASVWKYIRVWFYIMTLYFETSNACYGNIILQNSVLYYVAVSKLIKIENFVTNQVSINSIYKLKL